MAIEIPYLFSQAVVFVIITYSMIGYHGSAYKVFWYFYAIFSALLCFSFLGMLLVSLTPDVAIAGALTSFFYPMLNLFSGFLIPKPVSYPNLHNIIFRDFAELINLPCYILHSSSSLKFDFRPFLTYYKKAG